ncbi:Mfs transporter protein [Pleurostoma richardsiae]|uniref:Mfs transporter protein n=1 Tax=Pleurostoma richardsiae TaxID=41990 RepID=A0AA38SAL5_9PEZI|nr:Mfs transporter protein [Pleurostoma richardsiae]
MRPTQTSKDAETAPETVSIQLEENACNNADRDGLFYGVRTSPEELAALRKAERKLVWKLDLIILPLLSTVYFLAQMGRSDLGNAKIAGMEDDLSLSPKQYSDVASMFLVGYIIFQLPGTLLVRKIGPPLQFGLAMMLWGAVTTLTVVVKSYGGLLATRIFVGCFEAFIQGAVFYLSFWYTYTELATRAGIFYSTSALAGSFNGLLAYAAQSNLDGVHGWPAWRWIFFIEGIVPVGWAFFVIFILPQTPETASGFYFTDREKEIIVQRSRHADNLGTSRIRPRLILKLLLDPLFWLLAIVNMGQHFCVSTLSNFLPSILHGFGWSDVRSQLMSVVVYASALVGINFWSHMSDRLSRRGMIICVNSAIAAVGYALLLALDAPVPRLVAVCIVAASVYPNIVIVQAWTAINNPGYTSRGAAGAITNMVSTVVSIAGNQAYSDPPLYRRGNGAATGVLAVTSLVALGLVLYYRHLNVKKVSFRDSEDAHSMRATYTVDDISHRHPDIIFQL